MAAIDGAGVDELPRDQSGAISQVDEAHVNCPAEPWRSSVLNDDALVQSVRLRPVRDMHPNRGAMLRAAGLRLRRDDDALPGDRDRRSPQLAGVTGRHRRVLQPADLVRLALVRALG